MLDTRGAVTSNTPEPERGAERRAGRGPRGAGEGGTLSQSQPNAAMAGGALLLGLVFVWLTADATPADSNAAAARWLGVLLAGVGVGGLVFIEHVTITPEPARRCLIIERRRLWGHRHDERSFDEIAAVRVATIGQQSKGTRSYWLQLQPLRGPVIQTGRWSHDQSEIHALADRLAATIGCTCERGRDELAASSTTAWQVLAAAAGALLVYAIWFRVSVGPWCAAMWFGTAPPVILLIAFGSLLGLLRARS